MNKKWEHGMSKFIFKNVISIDQLAHKGNYSKQSTDIIKYPPPSKTHTDGDHCNLMKILIIFMLKE